MEKDDPGLVTAQILLAGCLGIGAVAWKAIHSRLVIGATEAVAAYAGVTAATVSVVVAITTLVIIAIAIPIIYYMQKPANCIVLLINELDKPLVFSNDYNVHGKPALMTTPIPEAIVIPEVGTYTTCGLIASQKRDQALFGSQYGFVMKYGDISLGYGVDCPLTGIYKDNNCYCAFESSAQQVAKDTDKFNRQYSEATKGDVKLSIRCNSGSGSIAYYIARACKNS